MIHSRGKNNRTSGHVHLKITGLRGRSLQLTHVKLPRMAYAVGLPVINYSRISHALAAYLQRLSFVTTGEAEAGSMGQSPPLINISKVLLAVERLSQHIKHYPQYQHFL